MGTVREYFDTDPRALTIHTEWGFSGKNDSPIATIIAKIAYDFEANAKYWYFYVPDNHLISACLSAIFVSPEFVNCRLRPEGDGVYIEMGQSDYSERMTAETLQYTKRVHMYLDFELSADNRARLAGEALEKGVYLSIRDREYARKRTQSENPLAFISHDSRDKDCFVRELALELSRNMCPVWYDEYSLKVGDSLRENIERGLRETKKCIVVLSPNFLSNDGWGRAEFDAVFTREILERQNLILPVWLNVNVRDVYRYSPRLADKVGLPANLGVAEVARRLANAVKS